MSRARMTMKVRTGGERPPAWALDGLIARDRNPVQRSYTQHACSLLWVSQFSTRQSAALPHPGLHSAGRCNPVGRLWAAGGGSAWLGVLVRAARSQHVGGPVLTTAQHLMELMLEQPGPLVIGFAEQRVIAERPRHHTRVL
jgi:hypothetical protein